ncbi:O-antigen ligase family protein [Acinetobacter soli]|uniref:O-antigen ligase family protein n=1 Tax=Acinetobacter soli TaxID=487316 RepID=UPI00125E2B4E|nr:hypothetical protein [Acinetobacter soli]MCF3128336.1 hypothetical protein [Acinetobacter soli]
MKVQTLKISLVFYCLILLSIALKNDSSLIADSDDWNTLTYNPVVLLIKNLSNYILIGTIFSAFLLYLGKIINERKIHKNIVLNLFFAVNLFFVINSMFVSFEFSIKILQALFVYISVFLISSALILKYNYEEIKSIFYNSLIVFSIIYIFLNLISHLGGYSYVSGNPRFFGLTVHPNFAGVHLAICNIIILINAFKNKKLFIVLLIGLWMQILTGSRTSIVILFSAVFAFTLVNRSMGVKVTSLISLVLLMSGLYFVRLSEQFDRGITAGDTRTEAWLSMLDKIYHHPFTGLGEFVGYSENSFLRVTVAFGIPSAILYVGIILIVLFKYYINVKNNYKKEDIVGFCLLFGLTFGGFFEGYLIDLISLPKIILVFLIIFYQASRSESFVTKTLKFEGKKIDKTF